MRTGCCSGNLKERDLSQGAGSLAADSAVLSCYWLCFLFRQGEVAALKLEVVLTVSRCAPRTFHWRAGGGGRLTLGLYVIFKHTNIST